MIEAQDIERINFHHKGKEKFSVEVNQITGTLELWVNGEKRNAITIEQPMGKFEEMLEHCKNKFLEMRTGGKQ
tara:strand:+ start:472 stop:690 length:219 start_codon:yes stop_codon:yes gene_type:complete